MHRAHPLSTFALTALALAACGGKDATGPTTNFPALSGSVVSAYCIRGDRTAGNGISGTLAATDCDLGDGTYYEAFRVRVDASGSYRFDANSTFDNIVGVLRLESSVVPGGPQDLLSFIDSAVVTIIDVNDDRTSGNTNALLDAVNLVAGTDYLLVVNGFGATDVGPYTVTFTKN